MNRRPTSRKPEARPVPHTRGDEPYDDHEVSRPDGYIDPYQGREYGEGQAMEMMSMAMEYVVGVDPAFTENLETFARMYHEDREMFDLTLGLLFHWMP